MALRANLAHRTIDKSLQLVRIGVRIARFDVLNGAVKDMGADGFFFHWPP
jgi:hypothetical protein